MDTHENAAMERRKAARSRAANALADALYFLDLAVREAWDGRFGVATERHLEVARECGGVALPYLRRTAKCGNVRRGGRKKGTPNVAKKRGR